MLRFITVFTALLAAAPSSLLAQGSTVAAERSAWTEWLATAPTSPYLAVAQQPIGPGVTMGPDSADVPLDGVELHRVTASGTVSLTGPAGSRALPRGRAVRLGRYTLVAGGPAGRSVVTVFDTSHPRGVPAFYDIDPAVSYIGHLQPPDAPATTRLLAPDGVEVEASLAGTVAVPVSDSTVRLTVMRIPDPGSGEATLEIYFRDATNGQGSYPAGRFVELVPLADGRYRLDFNRARNPFCAYSSAYACPVPWRGNAVPVALEVGERYVPIK
jgi:uncharacterized protein (DUF1684 family)